MRNLKEGWRTSSLPIKTGVIAVALLVVVLVIGGTIGIVSHFKDKAYQKREAQAEADRKNDEQEKQQLRIEKKEQETIAAEATAQRDAYKQVAESKRADKVKTIKELEQIEADHRKHKADAENAGNTLSDAELRAELCRKLAARGYPPCPN